MRIGSGRFRGRRIQTPKGHATRPTSGRLKKALFDILSPELPGSRILDLFAGTGALGLEAVSRGASWVTFVERRRTAADAVEQNLKELGVEEAGEVLRMAVPSALRLLAQRGEPFDLLLMDPPYRSGVHASVLGLVGRLPLLVPDGILVIEHHHKLELADWYGYLRKFRQVRAGESGLTFFRAQPVGVAETARTE